MPDYTIVTPSQLKVVKEEEHKGTYEIEGLYPGYGHTLGNSLRRIILSSLPGAAITSLNIEGVEHEYTALDGIVEDVITIMLNLKRVRFAMDSDEPETIKLNVSGKKTVTAKDIETSGSVEVLNPEQHICEITDNKGSLAVEMTVEKGLGFLTKEKMKQDKVDIGTIVTDAVFTPIRKVNYEVEDMRVGDRTDFNLLRMSIETDGTLTPRDALERSIKIMLEQLQAVLNLEPQTDTEHTKEHQEETPVFSDEENTNTENIESVKDEDETETLKTRIDSLNLSTRTANALSDASIRTLGGLVKKTEADLLELDGIGEKGIKEIQAILEDYGLALKQ